MSAVSGIGPTGGFDRVKNAVKEKLGTANKKCLRMSPGHAAHAVKYFIKRTEAKTCDYDANYSA